MSLSLLRCFARLEVSGHSIAVLWGATSRICSKQYAASMCSSQLAFSPSILSESKRYYLPNPSARAGYDTRSIFKRSLTGFEFRVFLLLD